MDSRQKDLNLTTKKPRTDAKKSKNVASNKLRADANKVAVKSAGIIPARNAYGKPKRNSKLVRILKRAETRPEPQLDKDGDFLYGSDYTPPKVRKDAA